MEPKKSKDALPQDRTEQARKVTWQRTRVNAVQYMLPLSSRSSTATLLSLPKSGGFLEYNFGDLSLCRNCLKMFELKLSFSLNKYYCRSNNIQNHSSRLEMSSKYSSRSSKYKCIASEVKWAHKSMFKRKNRPNILLPLKKFPQLVHQFTHSLLCARHWSRYWDKALNRTKSLPNRVFILAWETDNAQENRCQCRGLKAGQLRKGAGRASLWRGRRKNASEYKPEDGNGVNLIKVCSRV